MSCVTLHQALSSGFSVVSVIGIPEIQGNFIGKNLGTSIEKQQLTYRQWLRTGTRVHVVNSVIFITKLAEPVS